MWSKRRKKFARKYDTDKHRTYLFLRWFEHELDLKISAALERAMLFGIEDENAQRNISYGMSVADEIIRKCF